MNLIGDDFINSDPNKQKVTETLIMTGDSDSDHDCDRDSVRDWDMVEEGSL